MFETIDVTAIVATFVVFVAGAAIAITAIIVYYHSRKLENKERLAAIEKGIPLPQSQEPPKPYGTLKASLVWIAVGFGVIIFLGAVGKEAATMGFIPLFIGIALLIYWVIERQGLKKKEE